MKNLDEKYRLRVQVSIEKVEPRHAQEHLTTTQEIDFYAADFLEIARVLGQFQELARKIREESQGTFIPGGQ